MLEITIPASPGVELWDEEKEEFLTTKSVKEQKLELEHSLVSLSKWESKWCKPFYGDEEKTPEEILDYIKCMTLTRNVDDESYNHLTEDNVNKINEYIKAPMTATWFTDDKNAPSNREQITAELLYYYMIALNIPFECQKWHINRLQTLIKVCSIKNQPPKKMSQREIMSRNAALNAARRKKLNTRG